MHIRQTFVLRASRLLRRSLSHGSGRVRAELLSTSPPPAWLQIWPREQLFVINYDHFVYQNNTLLKALGAFMDLDLVDEPMPHVNLHSATERSIAAMCCETYCALQLAAYRESNEALYRMMDEDHAAHEPQP